MEEKSLSQCDAQQRVEQIYAFQQEMHVLENDDVIAISSEQKNSINGYHQQLLQRLSDIYDVDTSRQSKQLSLGMRIASMLGALAMATSIFFLFYQFWGYLSTGTQVSMLVVAPILLFLLSLKLAEAEKNAYYSKIAALMSLACFVLNLSMLGQIFNITPSPNAFAVWAAFSFLLAYACNARLLLFFAIVSLSSFIAMKMGSWSGMYWISFGERPENFLLPSLLIFLLPHLSDHRRFSGFASIYNVMAMIMLFLPILILSNWGEISYLSWSPETVEGFYQLTGFALSVAAIWLGVKRQWGEVTNTGNVFFILFLYTKFFDWWWEWMPKYIFFFILGLSALLALMVFKRVRLSDLSKGISQ
ncbi:DUF2157 domain-containing protein [Shewanella gelidimarina]|uniref:DUF2157 domain-containing protein n=1 Tax=Shewanella gelidimarina TaxID=56813 RepID=UPI00200F1BA9|nr:DUF2157 domain-containing protein [Shewanella gelidimarina]MCL1058468.1 DUF2157 domain-containing protein [Shewanella gelidimarina]